MLLSQPARKIALPVPNLIYTRSSRPITHTHWQRFIIWRAKLLSGSYEFQCLHGMGEPLYEQVTGKMADGSRPCRIYAPVGTHETLLAYHNFDACWKAAPTPLLSSASRDATLPLDRASTLRLVKWKTIGAAGRSGWHTASENSAAARSVRRRSDKLRRTWLANEHRLASFFLLVKQRHAQKWQAKPVLEQPVADGEMTPIYQQRNRRYCRLGTRRQKRG